MNSLDVKSLSDNVKLKEMLDRISDSNPKIFKSEKKNVLNHNKDHDWDKGWNKDGH